MVDYRDYGSMTGDTAPLIQTVSPKSQIYKATHDGAGNRLPYMYRSFISFSYGGIPIEDFNFIVSTPEDRIQRNIYGEFEDSVTNYATVDGQYFWGSHFVNNKLELTLATDGITEKQLNDFQYWFRPGISRELILMEHPNRAINARIESTPIYRLLPFEQETTVSLWGNTRLSSTTLYKGEINLSFVMDDPFWYAKYPVFLTYYTDINDKLGSMTNDSSAENKKNVITDKDFIKMELEDYTPLTGNIASTVHYGTESVSGILSSTMPRYCYYCGTAPGRPIISFTVVSRFSGEYVSLPYNSYVSGPSYNIISIDNNEFRFTIPPLCVGYNQAMQIIKSYNVGDAITDLKMALRTGINEYYSRAWAMGCVAALETSTTYVTAEGALTSSFYNGFCDRMKALLLNTSSDSTFGIDFTFDSGMGKTISKIYIRIIPTNTTLNASTDFYTFSRAQVEEDSGNAVRSEYLLLKGRNTAINVGGYISINECSQITTDVLASVGGLQTFKMTYQNLYL